MKRIVIVGAGFEVLGRKSESTEFYSDSRCGNPYEAIACAPANLKPTML